MDPKAPRMRKGNFSKQVITKELYQKFIKQFPEYNMSWADFYQNWVDIAETIRDEAITNPMGVKLGAYTGEIKLQYMPYPLRRPNFDIALAEEIGSITNHLNLLTKGKIAKIKWERRWAVKRNKMLQFFGFEPTREMRKMAKKHTDANPERIGVARSLPKELSVWKEKYDKKTSN